MGRVAPDRVKSKKIKELFFINSFFFEIKTVSLQRRILKIENYAYI